MKHLDAGRASLLCSHTLTFPLGAISTAHFHSMITKEKSLMIITILDYYYPMRLLFPLREKERDMHAS